MTPPGPGRAAPLGSAPTFRRSQEATERGASEPQIAHSLLPPGLGPRAPAPPRPAVPHVITLLNASSRLEASGSATPSSRRPQPGGSLAQAHAACSRTSSERSSAARFSTGPTRDAAAPDVAP